MARPRFAMWARLEPRRQNRTARTPHGSATSNSPPLLSRLLTAFSCRALQGNTSRLPTPRMRARPARLWVQDIRRWPGDCHNYIYDHMPLQGWWPWPKERAGSAVADPNMGTAAWEDELIFSPPSMAPHVICDDTAHVATAANQASRCVVM